MCLVSYNPKAIVNQKNFEELKKDYFVIGLKGYFGFEKAGYHSSQKCRAT